MRKIEVKSATRVDLAGGTLDLWPLYQFVGGAKTVNVAIDIFTYATLQDSEFIEWKSEDLNIEKKYKSLAESLSDRDPQVKLFQTIISFLQPQKGFRLVTKSESPVGGGLGGSSSLTISILKAFSIWQGRTFDSVHQLVHVAHNLEAQILNTPTGTQDYYPAVTGGINILSYSTRGIEQEVLNIESSPLSTHFLLVNTGKSHHSGLNNFEVMKSAVNKEAICLKALQDLKQISNELEAVVRQQSWSRLPELFNAEFEARVRLAPAFSSPEIEKLALLTKNAGAEAVKICGAGGGGCILVWTPPERREKVVEACRSQNFQVMGAKPLNSIRNPLQSGF
jgi:D-glycero-alpha-D-manno-heptose-7-phosphate kinase